MECIWLDGAVRKACRVLRRRLEPLGYTFKCRSDLPDYYIDLFAKRLGCTAVVSSDRDASSMYGWIYIPPSYVGRRNS